MVDRFWEGLVEDHLHPINRLFFLVAEGELGTIMQMEFQMVKVEVVEEVADCCL